MKNVSEALAELPTPPRSPVMKAKEMLEGAFEDPLSGVLDFDRPFYEMIVDGVHSHPNSVRVSDLVQPELVEADLEDSWRTWLIRMGAYSSRMR